MTETSGEKNLGRILSQNVLEKSLHSHMHTASGLCFKYTIRRICHDVSLSCHQEYNAEFRDCSEYCVKIPSIFHTYCSHCGSLCVCLILFIMQRSQPQPMLQALFLFPAIYDKSEIWSSRSSVGAGTAMCFWLETSRNSR